jgi:hypothetical protein
MQEPRIPFPFDFRNPDYNAVFAHRLEVLKRIRQSKDSKLLPGLFAYYRDNPIQFIIDWGCTFDPRNIGQGKPAVLPFIPWPRQVDWFQWVLERMAANEDGVNDKSRDMGASWMAVALSCTLGLFHDNMSVGFGSRIEDLVDRKDDPFSLFWKMRAFLRSLPAEFRRGWDERVHAPYMRITFPATNASIIGEGGPNIGRGGRVKVYFVDEAMHLQNPESADAALSQTTNCRIEMSSVKGRQGPFARRRFSFPPRQVFTFHWRSDPRKDDAWYAKQCERFTPEIVAQEIDINYDASQTGILIPQEWVQAAIDAHVKLGIEPTGAKRGALDVADEGIDMNAFAVARGVLLYYLDAWSGKGSDIFGTVERAFRVCDEEELREFRYDSDGLGAGVRGDARVLNERRQWAINAEPFRGSEAPVNPDDPIESASIDLKDKDDRTNKDYFANRKAQGWWSLRMRFLRTYRAVREGWKYPPDDLIFLSSKMPRLNELTAQLSQPTYTKNGAGKMLVDKQPEGTKSPNDADGLMILFAPGERKRRSFFDL